MSRLTEVALEFVDASASFSDPTTMLGEFSRVINLFGFNHFIMTGLPAYGEDVEKLIVQNSWPVGWSDRYREGGYFLQDPVSRAAFESSRQYRWSEARERYPASKQATQIEGEAKEFGLVDGLAFPMFDPNNWQAIVSLSSDHRLELPEREYAMVYLISALTQGKVTELLQKQRRHAGELTMRERDILSWMAHGKTRSEVGAILRVSEETVKMHLKHILAKLDVANTTQAVARAAQSRQIIL